MFLGADTEALRRQAGRTGDGSVRIEDLLARLDAVVSGVEWIGPDADAFRDRWSGEAREQLRRVIEALRDDEKELDGEAEQQDSCSGSDGEGGGSLWDRIQDWLDDYEPKESDGFFGDLLGGPESGLWGSLGWNTLSTGLDIWGLFPNPVATAVGLPFDLASVGIGLYDAAQSFQDGELFGTIDGLTTAGINGLDAGFGVASLVPYPPVAAVGEIGGIVTGGLDALWSGASILAQVDAMQGGDHGGSTSRFLLESIGIDDGLLDGAESLYASGSEWIRDQVPVLDPMIDVSQGVVENLVPQGAQESIEGWASGASDWVDDNIPWWH